MNEYKSPGESIRRERQGRKLSQAALAKLMNTSQKQISFYENNTQSISLDKLLELADVLNVNAYCLIPTLKEYRNNPDYLTEHQLSL